MRRGISLTLLLLLGCVAAPAWALESDRRQPVQLDADHAEMNNATGVSVYTGDVVMTQGTTRLTADKMTVYTSAKGELRKVVAEGREATFRQLPEGQKEYVNARAPYMEYVAAGEGGEILLKGGATLTQGRNSFSGETIRYDMTKDLVVGQGGGKGQERIRMTYYPEQKADQAEPAERPRQ